MKKIKPKKLRNGDLVQVTQTTIWDTACNTEIYVGTVSEVNVEEDDWEFSIAEGDILFWNSMNIEIVLLHRPSKEN